MRVEPLLPDTAAPALAPETPDAGAFNRSLDALGSALERAQASEDAFAAGSGSLQDAMYDRARADVALSVATAAAQRCAQAVQSLLNMQI
ncbi:MAG TPA: flagellar hook-basal body complex protein FliE [Candidatus Tumulicola sp.]|nr:flagellar hook-basal body complex protein FliE [Candidatus Tumulicola sp.]